MIKKVILVTGTSSGFGRQIAEMLSQAGHVVYGTVRKEPVDSGSFRLIKMDLTDPVSVRAAVQTVLSNEGKIDVLVNNAGMHSGGPAETAPEEHIRLQMETSFMGLVRMTREVLPSMRNQGGGTIINFSSVGGLMGLPFQSYYCAAKFAVEGFSDALRMEVKQFNIKIVVINPGDFRTSNSANRRNYLAPFSDGDPYRAQFEKSLGQIEKYESEGWEPRVLARKIVKIISSKNPRQRYVIASFGQKIGVVLKYILPGRIFRMIVEGYYLIR